MRLASASALHDASSQSDAGTPIVLLTNDATLNREKLLALVDKQLGVHELAIPRKIVMVTALPPEPTVWH